MLRYFDFYYFNINLFGLNFAFNDFFHAIWIVLVYSICLILIYNLCKKDNYYPKIILFIMALNLPISIIGAKIYHYLFFLEIKRNLFYSLFNKTGFSLFGGLILSAIFTALMLIVFKLNILKSLDYIGLYLPLGVFLIRIGCFLNGCCLGNYTNFFIRMRFPNYPLLVHPTQIYLSIWNLILFIFLKKRFKSRTNGEIFLLFTIFHSLGRFAVEFLRMRDNIIFNLSVNHIVAFIISLISLILYIFLRSIYAKK